MLQSQRIGSFSKLVDAICHLRGMVPGWQAGEVVTAMWVKHSDAHCLGAQLMARGGAGGRHRGRAGRESLPSDASYSEW